VNRMNRDKAINYLRSSGFSEEQISEIEKAFTCEDAISRQAVLDKLKRLIEVERLQGSDEMGYGRERVSAYETMIHSIKSEYLYPSVSVAEKVGEWIEQEDYHGDAYYDCSVCGNSWCTIDGTPWDNGMNYCPHCGAKMREDGEADADCN